MNLWLVFSVLINFPKSFLSSVQSSMYLVSPPWGGTSSVCSRRTKSARRLTRGSRPNWLLSVGTPRNTRGNCCMTDRNALKSRRNSVVDLKRYESAREFISYLCTNYQGRAHAHFIIISATTFTPHFSKLIVLVRVFVSWCWFPYSY